MLVFVILLTVVVIGIWLGSNYKQLQQGQKVIPAEWSGLSAQLKKRYEMVPEFSAFKNEAPDGSALFDKASTLAKGSASTPGISERAKAEGEFQNAFAEFLNNIEHASNVVEKDDYLKLREKLLQLEDEITVARTNYNNSVGMFNAQQKVFPGSVIAAKTGMKPAEFFDVEDTFARYPLKFKLVLPQKKPSIFMAETKEK